MQLHNLLFFMIEIIPKQDFLLGWLSCKVILYSLLYLYIFNLFYMYYTIPIIYLHILYYHIIIYYNPYYV